MNVHEMHQRFMAKVHVTGEDSCWLWTGKVSEKGYGIFTCGGTTMRAHRFSASGFRVPNTPLLACHRCDNPPCVNPDHLFFARPVDNTLDMIQKGRRVASHSTSETSRHRKLTREQVGEIRAAHQANPDMSYRILAEQYGVTKQAIYAVIKRKVWREAA